MKLPNIRSINIQVIKDAVASKKKNLLLLLLIGVLLVVGFSVGGVLYRVTKDRDAADIQLNRPNIEGIAKAVPGEQANPQFPAAASSDSTSPPSESSAPDEPGKPADTNRQNPEVPSTSHAEPASAPAVNVYNPFEFQYDRKHAEEKLKLIKELELEEIKAKIREAQQKGKKEAQIASSSRVSLPPLESLPKIQTSPRDTQSLQAVQFPAKEIAVTKKVRIPGYMGVMIDNTRRAVILDDGSIYELGSPVSEELYIDRINDKKEVYLKDIFGNVYKLKPSAYEVTLYAPQK